MKKVKDLPSISGSNRRPANEVSNLQELKNSGIAFATYGIRKGDTIEFADTMEDIQAFQQPVRENGTAMQTLVVVTRNGKTDYLSLGTLRKQDVDRQYTCDFTKEMGELNNDYERLQHLVGRKITCNETKTIKAQAFDRLTGERIDGETTDQVVPIIEWA
jgi:hypothetical protein